LATALRRLLQRLGLYGLAKRSYDRVLTLSPSQRRQHAATMALYGAFVSAGDVCFDVGANLGERVAMLRTLGARVVAVEPQEACLRELRKRFGRDAEVTIVAFALGRQAGTGEMLISQAHVLSSMSPEWVGAVRESGRFADISWERRQAVQVTTLDALIERHGMPAFCKIDVEGFEPEVLDGLTHSLPAVSFEFVAEVPKNSEACIDRLAALGAYEFNYDLGERMQLELPQWLPAEAVKAKLSALPERSNGDVYARLRT
jgi:FkbM family methyltransferase